MLFSSNNCVFLCRKQVHLAEPYGQLGSGSWRLHILGILHGAYFSTHALLSVRTSAISNRRNAFFSSSVIIRQ